MAEELIEPQRTGGASARAGFAIVLILLAALFAGLYHVQNGRENHSYSAGGQPPATVALTVGKQYEISSPGGVKALLARGGAPNALNCNYTAVGGSETRELSTTGLATDTRATHAVADFVAPVSGQVHIECRGLTATYVDDANGVAPDRAGLYLLLCVISLTGGVILGLSYLYRRQSSFGGRRPAPAEPVTVDDGGYSSLLGSRDELPGDPPSDRSRDRFGDRSA